MGSVSEKQAPETTLGEYLRKEAKVAVATAGMRAARFIDASRVAGRDMILEAMDQIDSYAKNGESQDPINVPSVLKEMTRKLRHGIIPEEELHGLVTAGAKVLRKGVRQAKELKGIDPANIQKLPKLLDDEEEDMQLKSHIVDNLISPMGSMSTFYDLIVFISNICLNQGISGTKLTAFFESKRILKLLLQKVFDDEYSGYRATNMMAMTGSVSRAASGTFRSLEKLVDKKELDEKTRKELEQKLQRFQEMVKYNDKRAIASFVGRLRIQYVRYDINPWIEERIPTLALSSNGSRNGKKQIDEETRQDLHKKLEKFKKTYDPTSEYTVGEFVKRLKAKYRDYDLKPWWEENMPFLIEMLRGYRMEIQDNGERKRVVTGDEHVKDMVQGAYENKTRENNVHEAYIRTHLREFLYDMSPMPVIEPKSKDDKMAIFMIDIKELSKFFTSLQDVATAEVGEGQIINMIARICSTEISRHGRAGNGIIIHVNYDKGKREIVRINNPEDIDTKMAEMIDQVIKVSSPHINDQNLLVNPKGIPEKIQREYDKIFDGHGNLKEQEYIALLRSIFEHRTVGEKKERIDTIKRQLETQFKDVNKILQNHFRRAGVKPAKELEEILGINEYSEIMKIAQTEKDHRRRYVARLKWEIFEIVYRSSYNPRFTFRKDDAERIKAKMEATSEDLQLKLDALKTLRFIDHQSGEIKLLGEITTIEAKNVCPQNASIGEIKLIPATFAGQDCYLLQGDGGKDSREYINLKTLESIVTKLILDRKTDPDEVTDLIRMTFVVNDLDELKRLKHDMEIGIAPGVRLIKWEDTYTEDRDRGMKHLGKNPNKSKKYKTLRAVCYIPVSSGDKPYIVKFEIRVLLLSDAIKEKSQYNETGHTKYERKRSTNSIPVLGPEELFPEYYEKEEKDPNDLSKTVNTRVKQVFASTASSEPQARETHANPSLPVS